MSRVKTGLDNLIASPPEILKNKRLGYLCNQASVNSKLIHGAICLNNLFPGQLKALFSPQHGIFGEKQDNMKESKDIIDPFLKIPVFSLYKNRREPSEKEMNLIDALIVDLQDVGTRVYTFIYTLSYCMEAAKKYNKQIIILDRPNPLGGVKIEGGALEDDYRSFVGRFPMPMQHGLTIGEIALLFNKRFGIDANITVIPLKNWKRNMFFEDTKLVWIPPSPNLPTPASALVYPGQVIWEGTNISEGRGTTQPFEIFGAPFIDIEKILSAYDIGNIKGAVIRPVFFQPAYNKWKDSVCRGFQIHISDPKVYNPYITSLKFLKLFLSLFKEDFCWKNPPYEYEFVKKPIDLILGSKRIRKRIESLEPVSEIAKSWEHEIKEYKKLISDFFLY